MLIIETRRHVRARHELHESVAARTGSLGRASPNIVTSWPEAHGCGQSGYGSGPSTIPSNKLSRNVSPRS